MNWLEHVTFIVSQPFYYWLKLNPEKKFSCSLLMWPLLCQRHHMVGQHHTNLANIIIQRYTQFSPVSRNCERLWLSRQTPYLYPSSFPIPLRSVLLSVAEEKSTYFTTWMGFFSFLSVYMMSVIGKRQGRKVSFLGGGAAAGVGIFASCTWCMTSFSVHFLPFFLLSPQKLLIVQPVSFFVHLGWPDENSQNDHGRTM